VVDLGIWPDIIEAGGGRIRIGNGRRLEYRPRRGAEENYEQTDNLKEKENLESLN